MMRINRYDDKVMRKKWVREITKPHEIKQDENQIDADRNETDVILPQIVLCGGVD